MVVFLMKKILKERQIEWLFHFTRAENLANIFQYGLLPRDDLENMNIKSLVNDPYRYDNCKDAVCTTIEFPNYKMFYPLRRNNLANKWAVLLINAKIICDVECAFCRTNAGSAIMFNTQVSSRKGKTAFLKLFEELPNCLTREEMGIKDWYPTDPQAEVLIFDAIPISYIESVFFENKTILDNYKSTVPLSIESKVNKEVFMGRADCQHW